MNSLRLFRTPGVLTAWADIFTGYLILRIAGIGESPAAPLAFLIASAACLHLSGMIWNDLFDYRLDAKQMPDRPLPSGVVSVTHAFLLGSVLMIAGILLAMAAGMYSFLSAATLAALLLCYHGGVKRIEALGAVFYGVSRAMTILMGMSVHAYIALTPQAPEIWLPLTLTAIYAASFAVLLRQRGVMTQDGNTHRTLESEDPRTDFDELPTLLEGEDENTRRNRAIAAILARRREQDAAPRPTPIPPAMEHAVSKFACAITLLCPIVAILLFPRNPFSLSLFLALLALLGNSAFDVYSQSSSFAVRHFSGIALLGIVLLDAGIVASMGASPFSKEAIAGVVLVCSLAVPAWLLGRRTQA